ncbi:HAMP domain-containing histidine kinase [archaeon]|nr:HAMP domain-containing histidine kinase [archaeon]
MRDKIRNFFVIMVLCAAFGYLVLSPFAMYRYHAVHMDFPLHEMTVMDVFTPELLPWSVPFAVFGGLVGAIIGIMYLKRKKAEDEIKKYAADLEQSNRLKDLFSDIIRHDLMNPAGIIGNMVTILKTDEKLKDSGELEVIGRNARKLQRIMEDSRVYSKLEAGVELEKSDLDLTGIIGGVIDGLGMNSLEKGISVYFDRGEAHKIYASEMIETVFVNIISNAIKYSKEGTEIKVKVKDDGKNKIVSIADQGDGIADEYKEDVFERFTRRDKSGVKGSGLGLAIVKLTVEMHGGRVWVEDNTCEYSDEQGRTQKKVCGSIFYVQLPKI